MISQTLQAQNMKSVRRENITIQTFDDNNWQILYQENFDSAFEAVDEQSFSKDNWLTFQLINNGNITVENGYAQVNAPEFWQAALIRSTRILPPEYKIRTKIGYINYDLSNYEQEDYDNPAFNDHSGHYENGMYFLTVTNDTCAGNQCAEEWWHYHRKMVIDVDNHLDWDSPGEIFHPLYMVYMAPETNSGGNLLRTWTGNIRDSSAWNWNVAYIYDYDTWYYAELEKSNGQIILRLYDENKSIIEETAAVDINLVYAMDDTVEYLYLGEPHTDDYEGNVRLDEITLLIPASGTSIGESLTSTAFPGHFSVKDNYPNPFNPGTTIEFNLPAHTNVEIFIFDMLGQKVQTLLNEEKPAGNHMIYWKATDLSAGVYVLYLRAGPYLASKRMMLMK
jgi:hypothetical protein